MDVTLALRRIRLPAEREVYYFSGGSGGGSSAAFIHSCSGE
jgi:hypothetical protein